MELGWGGGEAGTPYPGLSSAGCLQDSSPACPLSVPIPLSISIFIPLEFSPFHLSNQHRTCLSPPLSTSLLLCLLQPGARQRLSLRQLLFPPGSRRKSLFFSLNVQVNFYRLFIQPLYWLACYLLRKCSPQRERVGYRAGRKDTPESEGEAGAPRPRTWAWAGAGGWPVSGAAFGLVSRSSSSPCKYVCMCTWIRVPVGCKAVCACRRQGKSCPWLPLSCRPLFCRAF